ncbi:MAG: polymer-forming cytoskeletal protein [Caldilineaceae bacterium]|nr:polymer-forming cytoskeletal protein [Caldilineaceae bacterium]
MKATQSKRPKLHRLVPWWRQRMAIGLAVVMLLLFSGTALAAEVVQGDPYILPRGEVVSDDLYVTGSEVIIDGTVEGDLVVAAGYVEINGVVMGDLLAAGGAVVITGVVQDDVRAAGGGVILSGSVGDDFFGAAGGGWPGMAAIPAMATMQIQDRSIPQGLQVAAGATIGGDAYVAGGQGTVAGSVGRDLNAAMGILTFGGRVAGDANLNAESLTVQESALVQGELRYSTGRDTVIPEGAAASIEQRPLDRDTAAVSRNPVRGFFFWLWRTTLALAGYLLVGWLLWAFAPRQLTGPAAILEERPVEAGIIGLLIAVAVLPVAAALTFLAVIFWGWFPGAVIMLTFIFGLAALVWLLSPVITGLWVGRKLAQATGVVEGDLPSLLLGILVIVLVGRLLTVIPCIGDLAFQLIYLASFALAVGSWFLARRNPAQPPALLPAPVAPAV